MRGKAKVTVTLTPTEWADVVKALEFTHGNAVHFAKDNDIEFKMKLEFKAQAARLGDLIESLK
jgi:antitoxin component of MazEF toxin-antitoxin module